MRPFARFVTGCLIGMLLGYSVCMWNGWHRIDTYGFNLILVPAVVSPIMLVCSGFCVWLPLCRWINNFQISFDLIV
jgi:hypothetical protein